ncbi:TIGR03085 family metal-binding protein [Corynebacterium lizhenjunii]|nr:TIGR03085 family metal-binding protein [Corynebacterium lizhenjunii]
MSFSSSERARMVSLFEQLGPEAPTLCEGWTTRDLLAHLWVRENKVLAATGMFVPALAGRLDKEMDAARARDYQELCAAWGRGAGRTSPVRYLDNIVNTAEHFVHHEDIRRANPDHVDAQPREFSRVVEDKLHRALRTLAPRLLGKSRQPVVLYPEGWERIVLADKHGVADTGNAVVSVHGPVGELLLFVFGRDAAQVRIEGDAAAIVRSSV